MLESVETAPVRALFVDDEENILKALQRLLMDEDFEVLTASSAKEGLRLLLNTENVGLIVSDQRMPEITGVQFLEQAKEMVPDALRIMLTGYADISATMDAINRGGACRYITKPWNDEELVQTVRDAVRQYRLIQENRRLTEIVNRQNEELKEWNNNLKQRVLDQTVELRKKNEEFQRANVRLKQSNRETIEAFSRLVEMRGSRLKNHAHHVAELAVNAAKALGMGSDEVDTIHTAALLHDIGEIGIPEDIIGKRMGEMTPEELRDYHRHPVRGQTAVDAIEELRGAGLFIRHHHEHFDGSGFPDRLAGEAIPLGARIIAMADFIDRTMENLYGESAVANMLMNVETQAGKTLDPKLVPVFKKFVKYIYYVAPAEKKLVEVGFQPNELYEGLILARDVYSGTGMLLLNSGAVLDKAKIEALKRYYRIDPPAEGVLVLVAR